MDLIKFMHTAEQWTLVWAKVLYQATKILPKRQILDIQNTLFHVHLYPTSVQTQMPSFCMNFLGFSVRVAVHDRKHQNYAPKHQMCEQ